MEELRTEVIKGVIMKKNFNHGQLKLWIFKNMGMFTFSKFTPRAE